MRLADELNLKLCRIHALAGLGDLHLAHGRPVEAISSLEEQRFLLEVAGIADVDLSPAPELVELHLRQGDVTTAARLAAAYQDQARDKGQPWALARAARCRGLLAPDDEIDEAFTEALDAHGRTPDIFETARTHLAYGSRLRRSRQRIRARQELQAAIDIFDVLDANPWSAMARHELAATGERARQRNESTRNQLTPQELQIALLLAAQHTTKQAAAALFVSPKTVEYHLRNVYRKLGCNTRKELAVALEVNR
jgi:DNA-binding CsgD family transcriptional regulator